jgi:hypothetical protein
MRGRKRFFGQMVKTQIEFLIGNDNEYLHQQTANSEAETTHTMYKLNLFTKLLLG